MSGGRTIERASLVVTRVGSGASSSFLMWEPTHIAVLRGLGRVACTAIGHCALKVATNGKAAAVPVLLNDEELYVAGVVNDWLSVTDGVSGEAVDVGALLAMTAAADPPRLLRRCVFADLWRHGYRCTSGLKFGVDFLTYTADPSQVHAEFMVIVRPDTARGGMMSPLDLVGRARVATTALKICVLAYADVRSGSVRYAAFKRMGPGAAVFLATSQYLLPAAAAAVSEEGLRSEAAAAATAAAATADVAAPGTAAYDPSASAMAGGWHPLAVSAGVGAGASRDATVVTGGEPAEADGGLTFLDAASLAAMMGGDA